MAVTELPDAPGYGRGIHWVGATDPGAVGALEVWFDPTGPGSLKIRDAANAAWLTVGGGAGFVPVFFQADAPAPPAVGSLCDFTAFYDETSTLGPIPAGTGLTYDGATKKFTAGVKMTLAVTLVVLLAGGTVGDTYVGFQPSNPWYNIGIKIPSAAPVDATGQSQGMTYTLEPGDTFKVGVGGAAAQSPASDVWLFITRLA
jgi:hypothetical protein